MKTLLILAGALLLISETVAQISGPSPVYVGEVHTYTLNTGTLYLNESWGIINGMKITQSRTGTLYSVTILWQTAGAGKVTFLSNYVPITYKNVTVTGCNAPATPSTTLGASSATCGPRTLSYSGSPPSGVTWYWQTSSSGTSTASPTAYSASTSGTYYLRAKANCGNVWSSGAKSINVTVTPLPAVPVQPSVSDNPCGDKTLERGAPPLGVTWYWQGTNPSGTSTSNTNFSYTASASGTYYIRARDNSTGCWSSSSAGVSVTVTTPGPPYCQSDKLNWNGSEGFAANSSGAEVRTALSRTFLDGLGAELQSQAKNLSFNQVLAVEPIRGRSGRPEAMSLPAPINSPNIGYKYKFITNDLGEPYAADDFDKPNSSGAAGEIDNPRSVANGGAGTLGWYYSTSNNMEPETPVTDYPYSRTYVPEGPSPTESRSTIPGDAHKMGSGHEVKTERAKFTRADLGHYFELKHHFVEESLFENNLLGNPDAASTDGFAANQNVTISHVIQNGETYVKTVSNQASNTPGAWPIGGVIDVQPGAQYTFRVKGHSTTSNAYLFVRQGTGSTNIVWPGAQLPVGSSNEGWVESTFVVPSGVTSVRVGVLFNQPASGASFHVNALVLVPASPSAPIGYKVTTTDPNGRKTVSFTDIDGKQLASATLSGTTYDNWSYTYYNEVGQVVATVAPQGVNTGNFNYPGFVTTFKYDHLGRVIEVTSPDEGTSKFVYSLDGKIRFSQNQIQRDASPKRFSYTNYDKLGRLIEAGEYTMSGSGYYVFETVSASAPVTNSVLNITDNVGYTGITKKSDPNNRCSDYTYIAYNVQATDLPTGDPDHAKQTYTYGQVAKTENALSKTWYSYDDQGQLAWTKQYINDLSAYKTVDYTYDFTGNVTQVAYQKNQADDFYHHYTYDTDLRLSQVETSLDGTNKTKRAEYSYYLHGPLKRLKLMNGTTKVQGIDYVYTITGALKSINHADDSKDPGGDGDDVFGETIAYYDNDYSGAGYNGGSLTFSSYTNQYGGAIKGIGWRSPADNEMSKNAYAFTYDQLYRLTNSDFGTLTGTSTYNFSAASGSKHKETIGGYDKNGNITSLQRRDKDGTLTGDYDYVYHTASNKLDKINHSSSLLVDYTYNAIGQMTQQSEGGKTMNVAYNAYGLVKSIRNGSNQLMQEYFYDDQGNRFMSKIYYNGTLGRTLYYIHDAGGNVLAIYEKVGSTTTLIEVPIYASGRIATYKPQVNTYFYEVSDHLGNVRAVIGAPATDTYRATMESENSTLEEAPAGNFKNIAARRVTFVGANVTTNYTNSLGTPVIGNEVIRVNNTAPAGPGISLAVSPGDKLSAEVWAYYESGSSYNSMIAVSTMVTAIAGAFGGVSGAPGEAGQIYDDINSGVSSYIGNESGTTQPAAYLQYIVFDANRNPTGQKGFFRVTTASNMAKAKVPMPEITIEQPGFIYIFVYNRSDSPNWVFFDELLVTHEHSSIVAGADYYPFGLVMNGREITDEPYRWGYQGQFSEKDLTTGMQEFELRMYDPKIGRWTTTDPYNQYASPYVGMGNDPVMGVDPDGGFNWGATLVGAGAGFAVGSLVGLAVDQDNWWKYGIAGAAIGGIAGANTPDLTISESASGWTEFRAEVKQAILGGKGSVVLGRKTYYYGPGQRASWQTLANIGLPSVRQSMSQWCVFGCSESLNRHFGGSKTQTDFSRSYNGSVVDRGIQGDRDLGKHYTSNFRIGENGHTLPSPKKITGHLKKNNPISINVDRGTVNGQRMAHNMIIKGIQQNTRTKQYRLLIMDPAGQVNRAAYKAINKVHRYYFVILGL